MNKRIGLPSLRSFNSVLICFMLAVAARDSRAAEIVDQSNLPSSFSGGQGYITRNMNPNDPMGQEFTPTQSTVGFVDVFIEDVYPNVSHSRRATARVWPARICLCATGRSTAC